MSLHSLSRMVVQSKIHTKAPILTTRQHICFQNYVCIYNFQIFHIIINIYIHTSIAPNQVHCGPMSASNLPVIAIRFLWVDAKPILPSLTNFCSLHFSELPWLPRWYLKDDLFILRLGGFTYSKHILQWLIGGDRGWLVSYPFERH